MSVKDGLHAIERSAAPTVVDLTVPLSTGMPSHPSHFPPTIARYNEVDHHGSAASRVVFSSHTGTHVDAPAHYIADGLTVDRIPLDTLIGPAQVIRLPLNARSVLDPDRLPAIRASRVLIHTTWSEAHNPGTYFADFPVLSPATAQALVAAGVRLLGLDSPSPDHRPGNTHRVLLRNNVVVVENLTNLHLIPDMIDVIVMPLPLVGADACPARVVARFRGEL